MGEPRTEAFNDEITLRQPEQRTPHALHYLQSIRRIGIILPFYAPTCNPPPTLTKLQGKSSWARPMTPKMENQGHEQRVRETFRRCLANERGRKLELS
jgi:hypothetical protein